MREVISGLVGTEQKFQILDLRLKASSRNCELSVMTGHEGAGSGPRTCDSPNFQCSCSLCTQIRAEEWCPGKQKGTRVLKRPLAMGNTSAAMP